MCQQHQDDLTRWHRAMANRAYVRALLSVRQPEFLALLESAEREIDAELSACGMAAGAAVASGFISARDAL